MARKMKQLTAVAVAKKKEPGLYADGGGLYLRIGPTGAKSWIFRYMLDGRRRDMGLGPEHAVPLADARLRAEELRKQLVDRRDPLEARDEQRLASKLEAAKAVSFRECAEAYIKSHSPGWRNAKHAEQWRNTLATYADPIIGGLSVQTIDTGLVLKVLTPMWETKTETATRVRGRIESILDWATAREYRKGENPARWKGHLDNLLPHRSKVQKVQHHAALPVEAMGSLMVELRKQEAVSAKGLEGFHTSPSLPSYGKQRNNPLLLALKIESCAAVRQIGQTDDYRALAQHHALVAQGQALCPSRGGTQAKLFTS